MTILRYAAILALILCQPIQAHPPQAAPAIAADLYLTGLQNVYRVDLHTGHSQHVGDLDAIMQHLAYDSDSHTLYGVGFRLVIQPNGDYERGLYQIDTQTWACTLLMGVVAGPGTFPALAYDHTTGWLYLTYSYVNGNTSQYLAKIHPKTLELVGIGIVDPMGNNENQPIYFNACDPLSGALYGFQQRSNEFIDKQTGNLFGRSYTTGEPPRYGPAAFYPGTHTLYRYAYDGSGNAWLYHIDLATGQATKASVPFAAPGHTMVFLPSHMIR